MIYIVYMYVCSKIFCELRQPLCMLVLLGYRILILVTVLVLVLK